jgi:hypothetical protein
MVFLIVILGFGLLLAAIPCFCVGWLTWWLTIKLPFWLRLQITTLITTFLAALIITPIGAVGEGGAGVFPLGMILPNILSNLILGVTSLHDSLWEFKKLDCAVLLLCIWVAAYFISMGIVGICCFIKKRKNEYRSPSAKLSSTSFVLNSSESPQLAAGATADERLAPLVRKAKDNPASDKK